jgi:putative peptidoglycan lipid II flippase
LGVLNTHGRFFLSYCAPVLWNAAIICALVWAGAGGGGQGAGRRLVLAACFGALAGAALQLLVQMPAAIRLLAEFRPRLALAAPGVREAVARFGPALVGRGAVQLAGWLDLVLASFFTVGTLAALGWAQRVYLLPVALFGLSFAAVELPELARTAPAERARETPRRLAVAFRRSALVVAPTVVGFLVLGFLVAGLLYRGGSFDRADNWIVYLVLCGYTLGMPATVASRLLQNVFFAAGDTRTPARIAFARLGASVAIGAAAGLTLDRVALAALLPESEGSGVSLAAFGLALAASLAAWFELAALRRRLRRRGEPASFRAWGTYTAPLARAIASAAGAGAVWWTFRNLGPLPQALIVLPTYAALYLALSWSRLRAELTGAAG